jgi:hypothetical protein
MELVTINIVDVEHMQKLKQINSLFVWLVADGWCWFVLREKYCWLVTDKPNEQGARSKVFHLAS